MSLGTSSILMLADSSNRALSAGQRIPDQSKNPYWKDIRLPGGVKHSEWNGFHDLVLIEEFHAKDFGCAMGLFAGASSRCND